MKGRKPSNMKAGQLNLSQRLLVSGREDSNCPNPQAWDKFHFCEQGQVALASITLELELGS